MVGGKTTTPAVTGVVTIGDHEVPDVTISHESDRKRPQSLESKLLCPPGGGGPSSMGSTLPWGGYGGGPGHGPDHASSLSMDARDAFRRVLAIELEKLSTKIIQEHERIMSTQAAHHNTSHVPSRAASRANSSEGGDSEGLDSPGQIKKSGNDEPLKHERVSRNTASAHGLKRTNTQQMPSDKKRGRKPKEEDHSWFHGWNIGQGWHLPGHQHHHPKEPAAPGKTSVVPAPPTTPAKAILHTTVSDDASGEKTEEEEEKSPLPPAKPKPIGSLFADEPRGKSAKINFSDEHEENPQAEQVQEAEVLPTNKDGEEKKIGFADEDEDEDEDEEKGEDMAVTNTESKKTGVSICPSAFDDPSASGSDGVGSDSSEEDDGGFCLNEAWEEQVDQTQPNLALRRSADDVGDEDEPIVNFEGRSCWARSVIPPTDSRRMAWDLVALFLMTVECTVLPLQFFTLQDEIWILCFGWIVRIFWTMDLPLQFFTGFAKRAGQVEMEPKQVARHYLKTWFPVDLCMLLADWAEFFMGGVGSLNAARLGKAIKSLRMVRVTRMFKLLYTIKAKELPEGVKVLLTTYIRSEVGLTCLNILRIFVGWLWLNHVLGCCWYGIAQTVEDDGVTWLTKHSFDDTPEVAIYLVSFQWALALFASSTDIFPTNVQERAYAIIAAMIAYMASAYTVSAITTSMTRLSIAAAKDTKKFHALKQYLYENDISSKIATRVQRNAQYALEEQKRRTPESDIELLHLISQPLRVELHYEIYIPVLRWHPFFDIYSEEGPTFMRQVCHRALVSISLAHDDLLFCEGEASHIQQMYFLTKGQLMYEQYRNPAEAVRVGEWACEAVLWTSWKHCGTMRAKSDSTLLAVEAEAFQKLALNFKDTIGYAQRYGFDFVKHLRQCTKDELTDLEDLHMDVQWLASKNRVARGNGTNRGTISRWAHKNSKRKGSVTKMTADSSAGLGAFGGLKSLVSPWENKEEEDGGNHGNIVVCKEVLSMLNYDHADVAHLGRAVDSSRPPRQTRIEGHDLFLPNRNGGLVLEDSDLESDGSL